TAGSTLNNDADTDSGWNLEVQIPFTDLGISSISPGQVIGFTFWVNDDDLSAFTGTQHYFRWTTGTLSANPSTWGILQF
ncbi:MAG TPA: sugar-binding protein, partial [Leptospiraceae bacterium]|nr:sugar-binding protein [Leptospiraceae bacterium]